MNFLLKNINNLSYWYWSIKILEIANSLPYLSPFTLHSKSLCSSLVTQRHIDFVIICIFFSAFLQSSVCPCLISLPATLGANHLTKFQPFESQVLTWADLLGSFYSGQRETQLAVYPTLSRKGQKAELSFHWTSKSETEKEGDKPCHLWLSNNCIILGLQGQKEEWNNDVL